MRYESGIQSSHQMRNRRGSIVEPRTLCNVAAAHSTQSLSAIVILRTSANTSGFSHGARRAALQPQT